MAPRPVLRSGGAAAALLSALVAAQGAAAAAAGFQLPFDAAGYTSSLDLLGGAHKLFWKVDSVAATVEFAVAAQASGWVAVGFSSFPGMTGADIILAREVDGAVLVQDMHAEGYSTPVADADTDITVRASGRAGGMTWFIVTRPLVTCDGGDFQFHNLETEVSVLAAVGASDDLRYHEVSGREASRLRLASQAAQELPQDTLTADIVAPVTEVAKAAGSYVCSLHELPSDRDYHLVRFKVLYGTSAYITDVGGQIFHHVDMFSCSGKPAGAVGSIISCDAGMAFCRDMLLSGGYSGQGQDLPADTGFLINSENRYVMIQRHFYNVLYKDNVYDSGTGYRIWYTPTLRQHTMGRMSIIQGHLDVPVGAQGFDVVGYCPSMCTSALWPSSGITVTRVSFHMHNSGRKQYLQVIRDGKELAEVARAEPFDQSGASFDVHYQLMPGDTLRLHCIYDNEQGVVLKWGDARYDEMCTVNIEYYPKTELSSCADFAKGQTEMWQPDAAFSTMCNTVCQAGQACGKGGICEQLGWPEDCSRCACPLCDNGMSEPRVYCTQSSGADAISAFEHPQLCPGCLADKTSDAEPYSGGSCSRGTPNGGGSAGAAGNGESGTDGITTAPAGDSDGDGGGSGTDGITTAPAGDGDGDGSTGGSLSDLSSGASAFWSSPSTWCLGPKLTFLASSPLLFGF